MEALERLRHLSAQVVGATSLQSALISTVSKELRTPLTLIHGFAELLVLRDMPVERQHTSAVEILTPPAAWPG